MTSPATDIFGKLRRRFFRLHVVYCSVIAVLLLLGSVLLLILNYRVTICLGSNDPVCYTISVNQ